MTPSAAVCQAVKLVLPLALSLREVFMLSLMGLVLPDGGEAWTRTSDVRGFQGFVWITRRMTRPRGGGVCPALAESCIPSGRVVAVGFVFDSWMALKNEATLRAYSTYTARSLRVRA